MRFSSSTQTLVCTLFVVALTVAGCRGGGECSGGSCGSSSGSSWFSSPGPPSSGSVSVQRGSSPMPGGSGTR